MKKEKIAISLDRELLALVDSKVDSSILRSRSQAIEYFLQKGIGEFAVDTAVLLLSKRHHAVAVKQLKELKNQSLLHTQLSFLLSQGITTVYLITQHSPLSEQLEQEAANTQLNFKIVEKEAKGNAQALRSVAEKLKGKSFVAMSGDIYNNFNLKQMIKKHMELGKIITMGLMTRDKPSEYGSAILDGDLIIDFREKSDKAATHVVNAGIYICRPEVFEFLDDSVVSLEKDLFPKIARIKQLVGFFTHGEYIHLGE